MKTKPFNLEEYLANPSQKVVTRDGRPVRIICTDKKGDFPMVAIFSVCFGGEDCDSFDINGKYFGSGIEHTLDLFFADESEEPTEFEKELKDMIQDVERGDFTDESFDFWKSRLLNLASKQLEEEAQEKLLTLLSEAREHGRQEALKDIPKWKKFGCGIAGNTERNVFLIKC